MRLPLLRGAAEIHRSSLPRGPNSPQQVLAGNQTPAETAATPGPTIRRQLAMDCQFELFL